MWSNTNDFREPALHFMKYGFYTPDPIDSPSWHEYWDEQERRCLEGYSVGGRYITGQHYWYLNFKEIQLTREEDELNKVSKNLKSINKIRTFPDFWDGDAEYFSFLQRAWEAGKHAIILKTRRRGYSYKNSALASWAYSLLRKSQTYICAYEKELYKQLVTMTSDQLNFLNEHTGFAKSRDYVSKTSLDNFYVEASYKKYTEEGKEIKKGYLSSIQALTFKDNPDAARGKDGRITLWEEAGSFPNLKAAWQITQPSHEAGIYTTGQMIAFGTGGDLVGGADFIEMFEAPELYNALGVENIWDEGSAGTTVGFFVPDTWNKGGFIDKDGNSLQKEAKDYILSKRQFIKDTTKDPRVFDRHVCEYPLTPKEAMLAPSNNIFPVAELLAWQKEVMSKDHLKHMGTAGTIERNSDGILSFRPLPTNSDIKPIFAYPIDRVEDKRGAVVIYWAPQRVNGKIPDNLYIMSVDPYTQEGKGSSVGAAYVVCKPAKGIVTPDDTIVASFVGRPDSQDEFNRIIFQLAEYYNAKIDPETDAGDVIKYAKRTRKLHMLIEEWDIADKTDGSRKLLGRGYGHSLNGERRKRQAELYLRDWLLGERTVNEDGVPILNLHTIYDIGALEELIKYNPDGNFDRVSALLGAASYLFTEAIEKPVRLQKRINSDSFFNRSYFGGDATKYIRQPFEKTQETYE